jgi:CheY-like chemotaxis protein
LRVRNQPLCVYFSVNDTGIGIDPKQQAHIFQRFVQANNEIQSRYGGNGLGLSITQRLVELMGGHIGFRSTVDVGSQFWFTLPLVEVAPPLPAMEENDAQVDTSATAKKFLIVDDHPINRLLVRQILTNRWKQCDLVEADNGVKALEVLRHQSFDAVLMDMVMPEMDGIEATYELRTRFPLPTCNTPVLGLTANVNQADLGRFTAAGVNALVLKPFDATQLCEQIETLLTEKKSSQGS